MKQVPAEFKDFIASHTDGKGPSDAFMAHFHREYFHAQWKELLDDEFLEAYEHGVVIECCDGITRRFYLRIFAYSADYPEKSVPLRFQTLVFLLTFWDEGFFSAASEVWEITHARGVWFLYTIPIE